MMQGKVSFPENSLLIILLLINDTKKNVVYAMLFIWEFFKLVFKISWRIQEMIGFLLYLLLTNNFFSQEIAYLHKIQLSN